MVSLPRTCKFCGAQMFHYGSCTCVDARLEAIDHERNELRSKIAALDEETKKLLKETLVSLGEVTP